MAYEDQSAAPFVDHLTNFDGSDDSSNGFTRERALITDFSGNLGLDLPALKSCANLYVPMRFLPILLFVLPLFCHADDKLSPSVKQLLIAIAPDWNSMHGKLQRVEKTEGGWRAAGSPVSVLFGKSGLAWGRGLLTGEGGGPIKLERDHRAPAGVFRIGIIYTYDNSLPSGAAYPFHTVGPGDAWVDDIHSIHYNQHVTVDPGNPPPWFEKQKMRHGDFAYRWLIEVRHNSDPPVPGFGSAIFFHIRRGPERPSAGCTTMAEQNLVEIIRWLRSEANPEYVCLPKAEYLARARAWGLPDPAVARVVD